MIAKKTLYIWTGLLLLFSALIITPIIVFGANSDSITATFTLNATPVVSNVEFTTDTGALTATLTPDNTALFGVDFDISHSAGMTDMKNITVYIFDDSVHGADFNTSTPTGYDLVVIEWIEADAANGTKGWGNVQQGAFAEWTTSTSSKSPGNANASTTGDFRATFDISWAAYAAADWNVSIVAGDDDVTQEIDYGAETAFVTMNAQFDISYSVSNISWGNDIVPSSTNNTQIEAVTAEIRANAQWETAIQAVDFTPGPIDIDALFILLWDADNSGGGTSVQVLADSATIMDHVGADTNNWDNQVRNTGETNTTQSIYFLLNVDVGGWSVGQLYTTTITIFLQANT